MSVPTKTGDQVADAITFAIYAKHLAPEADSAGFEFWLDKCLDFDPAATLRWIKRAEAQKTLTPARRDLVIDRLRVRPGMRRIAERAGVIDMKKG